MGFRFIFLILAVIAIWLILRHLISGKRNISESKANAKEENVVSCKTCGLHIPESSAIKQNNQFYCCQEHVNKQ